MPLRLETINREVIEMKHLVLRARTVETPKTLADMKRRLQDALGFDFNVVIIPAELEVVPVEPFVSAEVR